MLTIASTDAAPPSRTPVSSTASAKPMFGGVDHLAAQMASATRINAPIAPTQARMFRSLDVPSDGVVCLGNHPVPPLSKREPRRDLNDTTVCRSGRREKSGSP